MTSPLFATIDIGNSRIKLGLFDGSRAARGVQKPVDVSVWGHEEEARWPNEVPESVCVGSVVPAALEELRGTIPSGWPTPTVVTSADFDLTLDVDQPENIGVDRVANAAAAAARFSGLPVVVVDAGTAITIDVVDATGVFRGGAIAPGLQMSADSLTNRTAQLPQIQMAETSAVDAPGRNTIDAITVGVQYVSRFGVAETVTKFASQLSEPAKLVYTGGDAEFFAAAHPEAIVIPGLTLMGLALAEPTP